MKIIVLKNLFMSSLTMLLVAGLSGCVYFKGASEYDLLKQDKKSIKKALEDNYSNFKSISGRAAISFSDAENRQQTSGRIYYKIPDSLFISMQGPVGETEVVAFLRPDSFFVENYLDKFSIRDLRQNFSLRRIGGIDIPFDDLKYSLYGFEPLSDDFIVTGLTEEQILLKNPVGVNRWQEIRLNRNLVIEEVRGFVNEQLDYVKQYDFFFYTDDHYLPRRIVFKKSNPPEKLTIFFESLELDRYYNPVFHRQVIK